MNIPTNGISGVIAQTDYVKTQEYCLALRDEDVFDPALNEKRRHQIITVVRDDAPAEFRADVGATKDFPKKPMFWGIGAIIDDNNKPIMVETVGRLMDAAHNHRTTPPFYKDTGFIVSDIPAVFQDLQEQRVNNAKRRGL